MLIIVGYFTAWALIHTALASNRVKKAAQKIFGPETRRFYRLFFVIFAIASIAPLLILMPTLSDRVLYAVPSPWKWILHGVQVIAIGLVVWTVAQTEAMDFLGIEQLRTKRENRQHTFQAGGMYGIVRHPMYFSAVILMWATPSMTQNTAVLFGCITAYFYIGSIHEEKLLVRQFGKQYLEYKKKLPRILPGGQLFRDFKKT
jgi:protein-S-isoprenylcysteine O-methyltransferase Ste14